METLDRVQTWRRRSVGAMVAYKIALYTTVKEAPKSLFEVREQVYALLRDTKWIIATSLVLALLLAVPEQITKLYRIVYSEGAPGFEKFLSIVVRFRLPILMIGLVVCCGAYLIVSESRRVADTQHRGYLSAASALPVLIGSLPLIGTSIGLLHAKLRG